MSQPHTIQYPHCVKFTPGQLDTAPWSAYETRSVQAEVRPLPGVPGSDLEPEFAVFYAGRMIACQPVLKSALASAVYVLMAESRTAASKAATQLP